MNGLSLRISTGAKKNKNVMSLSPAVVTNLPDDIAQMEKVRPFLQAATASDQLTALNQLLKFDADDPNIIKLLVILYFHSEAKHPVKCFLTRHITKNKQLQESFTDLLRLEISLYLNNVHTSYISYKDTVRKIGMCLESFPAGTCAVESVRQTLAPYLNNCFQCCLQTIRLTSLSPTEKNVVYSLTHLTLRILLHIITKIQPKPDHNEDHILLCKALFKDMRESLDVFLMDCEMPMDTKSVCGLVALALDAYRYDDAPNHDAWIDFVYSKENSSGNEEAQLAIYSAIITAVPMGRLQETRGTDEVAPIEIIVGKLMNIVEKCSSDGVLILGVSRALSRLGKSLGELDATVGRRLGERLLTFVWAHLDHYMDSVSHQAAEILATTLQYYAQLELDGRCVSALPSALRRLAALGVSRGYCAGLRGAARALAAARLLPAAPPAALLPALRHGDLLATVSYTLDDLLTRHSREVDASAIYNEWVLPILEFARTEDLEPHLLTTLENLLDKAVQLNKDLVNYILPHIKQACESPEHDLKNVLVLLSVVRPSLAKLSVTSDNDERWGGVLSYEVLNEAVVDARDEVRVTAVGLACRGGGAAPRGGEGRAVRGYLTHCGRESAHVRQLVRPMLTKFIRRLFDAHRAALRAGNKEQERVFQQFIEEIREDCYRGLHRGASLPRRATALELLLEIEGPNLKSSWKVEYVEKLLSLLDDSYELNKKYAVELLCRAPIQLLEEINSPVLSVEDILSSACALRPSECATAAVRLELVWKRLPHRLIKEPCSPTEPALYSALSTLLSRVCPAYDALRAPRDAPTYGLLQGALRLLDIMDPESIVGDKSWQLLIERIIDTCSSVLDGAGAVVSSAAPEGALPADCTFTDYGNNAGVLLEDGRQVTAQMVLLCAWRTVKEATGVLGCIGARAPAAVLGGGGLRALAARLARVLAAARHRGAFEQAYVAFERLLARMWRDPDKEVCAWPARQLQSTLDQLREPTSSRLADRRSAGLPFLIQALVSTEPGAGGPGTGLRDVMATLLDRAAGQGGEGRAEEGANDRAHACNILRALYRDSSLDSAVQSYVGDGLRVALQGFEGATWTERNSSTLLLSALMQRVFGPARRLRMTGRVFFLRYPQLHDIMLNKLKEANESETKLLLCPSLYPVLLLLGRLHPSSLEGTESNLKLVSFVPHVVRLARSRVLLARRLAAAAAAPLVAPHRYVAHLQYLLGLVSEPKVEMNFCHGILLQICALLEHKPTSVDCSPLAGGLPSTLWLLTTPCWPALHQHAAMLTALQHRFPETLQQETLGSIEALLRKVLEREADPPASGRPLAMAACLRLLLLLTTSAEDTADVIISGLRHDVHAVSEAALDYLLTSQAEGARGALRARAEYLPSVAEHLRSGAFWRTQPTRAHKHLQVLVAEGDTQELILGSERALSCDDVIEQLTRLVHTAPDTVTHLYLDSLTSYISPQLPSVSALSLQRYCSALWRCVREAGARARGAAGRALHRLGGALLRRAGEGDMLATECCVWACTAQLLRDPDEDVRAPAAAAALALAGHSGPHSVVPERAAGRLLRAAARRPRPAALLAALALCSARREPEDTHAEWRVFEPREQEIALAEDMQWTAACVDKVIDLCSQQGVDPLELVTQTLDTWTFPFLDNASVDAVKRLAVGEEVAASPVVEMFVRKLKGI